MAYPVLTTVIFLPVIGALLLLVIKRERENLIKWLSLTFTVLTFLASLPLFFRFDKNSSSMQFVEVFEWIPAWNIKYYLGVDGISVLFILLSALLGPLCVLISWNSIKDKVKEFYIALLLIEAAMIGVFCALDFFLFYIFWEANAYPHVSNHRCMGWTEKNLFSNKVFPLYPCWKCPHACRNNHPLFSRWQYL
jgi:NADH-quinone oxidoreductase subunit M